MEDRNGGVDALRARRLRGQLDAVTEDVRRRADMAGGRAPAWKPYAETSIEKAESAGHGDNHQLAWLHLHRARRFLYEAYDETERQQRARALRFEAEEKLTRWRKQAVLELLPTAADARAPSTGALVLAQFLLDEHFENVYFKLEMLGQRVRRLPWLLGALVLLLLLVAFWLSTDPPPSIFFSPKQLLLVLLLGATGAGASIALSLTQLSGRIPEVLKGWTETAVRPLMGGLSAVITVGIVQSGVLPIEVPTIPQVYAYALVAGFSDQLLVRLIAAAEKGAAQ